ncbi:anti-sigma factor antagonist [Lachnospiraceae bacterium 47-T17]
MEFQYEARTGSLRIFTPREIDECAASALRAEADELIDSYQIRHLIFDFSNTEFMDSSGIGMLIGRSKKMGYTGGSVEAENLSARVQKIFKLAGLPRLITMKGEQQYD